MEIENVQLIKPFGPLMLTAQIPEGIIKTLNGIVDVIKDNKDMGGRLAGVIKSESEIPHSMLEEKKVMNIFHSFANNYVQQGLIASTGQKNILDIIDVKTQMQSIWSVSQYENEYNPQHNHSNCQISAVLYLKIPTMTPRNIPDKQDKDGNIEFTFCNRDNIFTASSFVLEPQAGMLILFPNSLNHQVYPFQGSGERRSIAFNMSYKAFKKDSGIQILGDGVNMYNEINFPETIPWRRLEK